MSPSGADVQAAFCQVLVDEWARAGVTEAVVAPGSRSTPLVAALDRDGRLRVHVILDERSAGFLAVGAGLATGRPAVVVTTSGTAAVELHPAMVEAAQAWVPLIAVTTDRPAELHQVGAPQTVEQEGLFGNTPRWACSPGVADLAAASSWRSLASRSVIEAVAGPAGPGPVQVNLAFREPLIGSPASVPVPAGRPEGAPWHAGVPGRIEVDADHLAGGRRGLVVAGEGAGGPALIEAAARLGWPVLADPRSGCRLPSPYVVAAADALLRVEEAAGWVPDLVVRAGAGWASKVVNQWLSALPADVPQVLVDRWGRWHDPDRQAAQVVTADPLSLLATRSVAGDSSWSEQWATAERAAQAVYDELLGPGADLELSEPAIARAVVAGVPDQTRLVVSSSMPVRDVEWYGAPRTGLAVLGNRGANGIDGVLSTAVGAALGARRPTVALLGDLAFLHDAGALLWASGRDLALTVIVVDNDGGGIFSFLPQAEAFPPATFERYWGTPHGISLPAVARAYGADACEVRSRADLTALLSEVGAPGLRVGVVASNRVDNVAAHDTLHRAVAGRVKALGGLAGAT